MTNEHGRSDAVSHKRTVHFRLVLFGIQSHFVKKPKLTHVEGPRVGVWAEGPAFASSNCAHGRVVRKSLNEPVPRCRLTATSGASYAGIVLREPVNPQNKTSLETLRLGVISYTAIIRTTILNLTQSPRASVSLSVNGGP